ncbi:ethanolamine ammonia-lyase subunit EutC [Methylibium sp.]|uniref:ethanolamine ammonia-lyase subunit EutC n=1 Tax=Methylibium sp. TaxID=2067992 RepID=UPI00183919F8|nr:ethanolamine ammonia-lyase subunit EutC [Methylibium sp.]MBA3590655.1 ethanolamine ammonia-lyase subunit EutC [Methylibium sp.]
MSALTDPLVIANPWHSLRRFTAARIALGRAGISVPTAAQLQFRLDHARARDAVHLPFDTAAIRTALEALQWPALTLHSAAADRRAYLQRPDLGRRLDDRSRAKLGSLHLEAGHGAGLPRYDLAFVIADGLSALAVHRHAVPLLAALRPLLAAAPPWRIAPVAVVQQARVAIGDEIGAALGADLVVVLIGERPGLSSPDSLGLYVSWKPRVGLNDAERNCISNVRPEGLPPSAAAAQLHHLLGEARRLRLTGVGLKDESPAAALDTAGKAGNFLLDGPTLSPG